MNVLGINSSSLKVKVTVPTGAVGALNLWTNEA